MYTDQLIKIYNTLMLIETKGNNTLIMAQCLEALEQVLTQMSQQAPEISKED